MAGTIQRISGPVVHADGMRGTRMFEVVMVGTDALIGEIIGLNEDLATIQVYEDTTGITPGEPVKRSKMSLSVELGPGLLGRIFDGIQRPLTALADISGDFIVRGVSSPALSRDRRSILHQPYQAVISWQGVQSSGLFPRPIISRTGLCFPPPSPGRWSG